MGYNLATFHQSMKSHLASIEDPIGFMGLLTD